jgi:hypothetical protein
VLLDQIAIESAGVTHAVDRQAGAGWKAAGGAISSPSIAGRPSWMIA